VNRISANSGSGFSLIEVVLAIGIITFVLLVVFSLMPVGLQDANRQLVNSEIFGRIEAELAFTPYDSVAAYQATRFPRYFDNEGLEVRNRNLAQFIVLCDEPVSDLGGELKRITVRIGFNVNPDDSQQSNVSKRTFVVADRGN